MKISFRINGKCLSKKNHYKIIRIGNKRKSFTKLGKDSELERYEANFYLQVPSKYKNLLLEDPFFIKIQTFQNSISADIDGPLTTALDCLEHAKIIKNDNRCIRADVQKYLTKGTPYVIIELEFYEGDKDPLKRTHKYMTHDK